MFEWPGKLQVVISDLAYYSPHKEHMRPVCDQQSTRYVMSIGLTRSPACVFIEFFLVVVGYGKACDFPNKLNLVAEVRSEVGRDKPRCTSY